MSQHICAWSSSLDLVQDIDHNNMTASSVCSSSLMLPLAIILLLCSHAVASDGAGVGPSCYTRMFSFGDSLTDTGNVAAVSPNLSVTALPYGETFFHRATGRFSDGRLIVDFIAEALRLPFLPAYLRGKTASDFRQGVNFAVAGATALPLSVFRDMGLDMRIIPPFPLDVQLEWFNRMLSLLAPTEQERKDVMENSLFLMGKIGSNDYNHPFFQNRSFETEIKPLVPKVIAKIEHAVKVLIGLGAKTVLVPGVAPTGCTPRSLAMFPSNNPGDYDQAGCLRWLNDFAEYHNHLLRTMLLQIPSDPTVTIIYADYYSSIYEITSKPLSHGFSRGGALVACCGDGGPYNSGTLFSCNATSLLCPDPSKRISWDGQHYTEAAYHFVSRGVLNGPYASPPILSKCKCL
ncbi:hypothetical protein ACP4OV_012509 [Aristida adscensionis]